MKDNFQLHSRQNKLSSNKELKFTLPGHLPVVEKIRLLRQIHHQSKHPAKYIQVRNFYYSQNFCFPQKQPATKK